MPSGNQLADVSVLEIRKGGNQEVTIQRSVRYGENTASGRTNPLSAVTQKHKGDHTMSGTEEKKGTMMDQEKIVEMKENELDQIVGGIVTEAGAKWLTELIVEAKSKGSTLNNVMMIADFSSGKGSLAQTTPAEAREFVKKNWDKISV